MPDRGKQGDRADRILDAAGELLLRLGYRKVTIEDVARQAHIGKGTVYLHWRTKDLLFEALLLRESIDLIEELLSTLRQDPGEARPHRFVRTLLLATTRRPLVMALFTRDIELLGKLASGAMRNQKLLATEQFFELMIRHRLLRDDIPNLRYTLQASTLGFYLLDGVDPDAAALGTEAKADAIAHTVREAFEPTGTPDAASLTAAATEITAVYEHLISSYRKWIYAHDPQREPG